MLAIVIILIMTHNVYYIKVLGLFTEKKEIYCPLLVLTSVSGNKIDKLKCVKSGKKEISVYKKRQGNRGPVVSIKKENHLIGHSL